MAQPNLETDLRAQKKVARKYKALGYDVLENPRSNFLPDFLDDLTPDIVARSNADNVIIEVKRHASLKGSNDLLKIAESVSNHPGWRFELVVLDDAPSNKLADQDVDLDRIIKKVNLAVSMKLYDLAYVYLTDVIIRLAYDLAHAHRVKSKDRTDRDILMDLAFKGILPDNLLQNILNALSARNEFVHAADDAKEASERDVAGLLELCETLSDLS
jgi:uncharacterized protein YutE (UPF0331/DUF86 family)